MSTPGAETKPPDPKPMDLVTASARVVVKPAHPELPTVSLSQAQATQPCQGLPRVAPSGPLLPANPIPGQSIFTPSPSHLIVPTAKSASLRPPIRPLQQPPLAAPLVNVHKMPAAPQTVSAVKATAVLPHVSRTPVPVQTAPTSKRPPAPVSASLIRAPQFSSHVPRGPATVASITSGPKTAVATPIIRQQSSSQNVVLASSHIPVGARTSAAALAPTRSFAPVTMVEVSKQANPGQGTQVHLGLSPSITIESGIRASGTPKQTVYAPAIFQPVASDKGGTTTTTYFKTNSAAAQFNKTFTPITTSQPQAVVQPVVSSSQGAQLTLNNKVGITNQGFNQKMATPIFVTSKPNVVITTAQRQVRQSSLSSQAATSTATLSIPMAKVFQQPLTVTGSDLETQPQPIGFMTAAGPRLQLPVISVGGQNAPGATPGAVVLTGDTSRPGGTTQYTAVPAGTYLTYETYTPAYFGGQSGPSTPVHLTTATIPGVRAVSPARAPFGTTPRPLMVTVDTKLHQTNTSQISVTAGNKLLTTSGGLQITTSNSASIHSSIESSANAAAASLTESPRLIEPPSRPLTTAEHSTKLANLTEKVITQALSTPVNPPTAPLPVSVTGITSQNNNNTTNQVSAIHSSGIQGIQGNVGSPSRPSILRKRAACSTDGHNAATLKKYEKGSEGKDIEGVQVKIEPSTEDNNNVMDLQNGQVSPRKKPRKQLLHSNELVEAARAAACVKEENGTGEGLNYPRPQLFNPQSCWKTRHNHFVRPTDVRSREEKKPTVNELANQKLAAQRAHGWKLYHIKGQVEEVGSIESDVFERFNTILKNFEQGNRHELHAHDDDRMFSKITDLIKGNLQRSKIMQDQVGEVKNQLGKVLDHKNRVLEVIGKYMSKRPLKKREKM